jgi:hypothetical protein
MSAEDISGVDVAGKNPPEGLVEIVKDANSLFTGKFAEDCEHAGQADEVIAGYEDGAASIGREDGPLGQPADVVGCEIGFGDVGTVEELRKAGIEDRILEKFFLVRQGVGYCEDTGEGAHDQPAFLVDSEVGWHGGVCSAALKRER